jgi:hypothetical protein
MLSRLFLAALAVAAISASVNADIVITEVHSTGSSSGAGHYNNDWFELTNTGGSDVNITGWIMDDNSNNPVVGASLNVITVIPAGKSVVFVETDNDSTLDLFKTDWFGSNVPVDFLIGRYKASNVGLSSGGDAVNIYNSSNVLVAGVTFGSATLGVSFDNHGGAGGAISDLSVDGQFGAFISPGTSETGSPGAIANAVVLPEPASLSLLIVGGAALLTRRRSK